VALARVPWPLPAKPQARDELQLAEALRSFRVVRARPGEIVAKRDGLTLVFRQVEPHRAAVLFRRGELDDAPVPLGDIRAALADEKVGPAVRVRPLRTHDALVFTGRVPAAVRDVLAKTAVRNDYAYLVPEDGEAAAPSPPARLVRAARRSIPTLPHARVRIAVGRDPTLRYGASLLVASWQDLRLDVALANRDANARFTRVAATGPGIVPIARTVDARFVSPRLRGWREDDRGVVDYARVRVR
jgi:hypothetical protein